MARTFLLWFLLGGLLVTGIDAFQFVSTSPTTTTQDVQTFEGGTGLPPPN